MYGFYESCVLSVILCSHAVRFWHVSARLRMSRWFYMAIGTGKVRRNAIFNFCDRWWHKLIKHAGFEERNTHNTFWQHHKLRSQLLRKCGNILFQTKIVPSLIMRFWSNFMTYFVRRVFWFPVNLFHELPRKNTRLTKVVQVFLRQPSYSYIYVISQNKMYLISSLKRLMSHCNCCIQGNTYNVNHR